MHKRIINFVKYNKAFLALYHLLGNILILILKCFVRCNDKKILFMSYGGRKFDDSPKALYETIKADAFFKDYELVWGFLNPQDFNALGLKTVKVDTLKFYITAISSHIWINNSSVERGLNLRTKSTLEINTWHGTPLKKMGNDIQGNSGYSAGSKAKGKI